MYRSPEQKAAFEQYVVEDIAEREKTGETLAESVLRMRREWVEADVKSAKLREEGNTAFRNGDYKAAYVLYTACTCLCSHDPLYFLNRAAVALKLKLYRSAVEDATDALEQGDFNPAKALFRRAQGRSFLGDWVEAEEDYTQALGLQPGDRSILNGVEELKRLRSLSADEQVAWISEQGNLTLPDIFEGGEPEFKRRVEEILGHPVPE
ncbi:hypothetical protein B0H16DRAFT_1311797 [Mycena metata]|uniref:Uncharacterized protein n=1 Tax=Mycena metata TaxID=1033252 RepID=A0AAD7NHJ9_9AGAR|nr:hypothetical protein B0H16DRAFT_1311797 [Mycena metata]